MSYSTYILDEDHNTRLASTDEWARWMSEHHSRRVELTEMGNISVSTIFLGLDHNYSSEGPPLLFETLVFGGPNDQEKMRRYSTWDEAVEGHKEVVKEVKSQVRGRAMPRRRFKE